jgi:hypothetical protein
VTTSVDSDLSAQALAEEIGKSLEAAVSDEALKVMVANKGFRDAN